MNLTKREQNKLVVDYHGFIRSRAVEFWKDHSRLERDDVIQEAFIAAIEAAEKFAPDKGGFPDFVSLVVRRRLLNYFRNSRPRLKISDEEFGEQVDEAPEIEDVIDARRFIEKAQESPLLSRRLMGHTLHQIGTEEGVHKSTVKRREDQELKALQPFMPDCATRDGRLGNLREMDPESPNVPETNCPALVGRG